MRGRQPGSMASSYRGSFSSRSLDSYPRAARTIPRLGNSHFGFGEAPALGVSIQSVTVDSRLLVPVELKLDPSVHSVKLQEKEEIKGLNNRFASFIDKVRQLQQDNAVLKTKWQLLQQETQDDSNLEPMLKSFISKLQSELDTLRKNQEVLSSELQRHHFSVEQNKNRYEDEINKRHLAENDFVILKKDADAGYLGKVELDHKLDEVLNERNFFKAFYQQELKELKKKLKSTSVVVEINNNRLLNVEQIVDEVKHQYEEVSARSRQEAETWYRKKFELVSSQADQRDMELKKVKNEVSELEKLIARFQTNIAAAKAQNERMENQIMDAEEDGEQAVSEAQRQIRELEEALRKARHCMAKQVREYQELMNIKLALDIEIATYKKLLEGEEHRIGQERVSSSRWS